MKYTQASPQQTLTLRNTNGSSNTSGNGRRPGHPGTRRNTASPLTEDDIPRIASNVLLGAGGRVVIDHRGQRYELRETRYGKLILTK